MAPNDQTPEEIEEEPLNLVSLTDENGNEQQFNQLDYLKVNGAEYVAMVPYLTDPADLEEFDGQLMIMKVVVKNGENMLYFIEDDAEFEKISGMFVDRLSEDYDILNEGGPDIEVIE